MTQHTNKYILLTFDVEDWFQVENFKSYIPFSSWSSYELRVETNTHKILDLLDSFSFSPKATFFIMGWIAQKLPQLVREIQTRGHEVASHGFNHHLCTKLSKQTLFNDIEKSRKLLEDITGTSVIGYRAPSFAINNDILKLIRDAGYLYDSSYNSFGLHGRYGKIELHERVNKSQLYKIPTNDNLLEFHSSNSKYSRDFYEIPISNLSLGDKVFPLGGGGYFRLIPFPLFGKAMKIVLNQQDAFVFYSHPWEFDPSQPRVKNASKGFKFRHYTNLKRTEKKLTALIDNFSSVKFLSCGDYVNKTL